MKKYLSIGEVSKIKRVSHTSLRYYDEIGILTPAYTNPENGYRYYSNSQMLKLDLIIISIELGIPLKDLSHYIQENNELGLEDFISYAKNKVNDSIKKLERDLYFLDTAAKHVKENSVNVFVGEEYTKSIEQRCFLTLPFEMPFSFLNEASSDIVQELKIFDISKYWEKITELYFIVTKYKLSMSIEQGLCFFIENGKLQSKLYVEIKKIRNKMLENARIINIPKNKFICSYYPYTSIMPAIQKHVNSKLLYDNNMLILSDILEKKVGQKDMSFEMQIMA